MPFVLRNRGYERGSAAPRQTVPSPPRQGSGRPVTSTVRALGTNVERAQCSPTVPTAVQATGTRYEVTSERSQCSRVGRKMSNQSAPRKMLLLRAQQTAALRTEHKKPGRLHANRTRKTTPPTHKQRRQSGTATGPTQTPKQTPQKRTKTTARGFKVEHVASSNARPNRPVESP
mgnify:FL=1